MYCAQPERYKNIQFIIPFFFLLLFPVGDTYNTSAIKDINFEPPYFRVLKPPPVRMFFFIFFFFLLLKIFDFFFYEQNYDDIRQTVKTKWPVLYTRLPLRSAGKTAFGIGPTENFTNRKSMSLLNASQIIMYLRRRRANGGPN